MTAIRITPLRIPRIKELVKLKLWYNAEIVTQPNMDRKAVMFLNAKKLEKIWLRFLSGVFLSTVVAICIKKINVNTMEITQSICSYQCSVLNQSNIL